MPAGDHITCGPSFFGILGTLPAIKRSDKLVLDFSPCGWGGSGLIAYIRFFI